MPTGDQGEQTPANSGQIDCPEDLAAIQIQSLLIGGTQALGSSAHGSVVFSVKQIQDIIWQSPLVVEKLRKEGINVSDRIQRLTEMASVCASSASSSTTSAAPSAAAAEGTAILAAPVPSAPAGPAPAEPDFQTPTKAKPDP